VQINEDKDVHPSYFPNNGILFDAKDMLEDPNMDAKILEELEKCV
jgi:hypothetical protein